MERDEALAVFFLSLEPAASAFEAFPLLYRSHFHCACLPGQESATIHRAEASPASCLYKPISGKSMSEKNPTAVINGDKHRKSSAEYQRANLHAAGLVCSVPQ